MANVNKLTKKYLDEASKQQICSLLREVRGMLADRASQIFLDAIAANAHPRTHKSVTVQLLALKMLVEQIDEWNASESVPTINQLFDVIGTAKAMLVCTLENDTEIVTVTLEPELVTVSQMMRVVYDSVYQLSGSTNYASALKKGEDVDPVPGHNEDDEDSNPIPGHDEGDDDPLPDGDEEEQPDPDEDDSQDTDSQDADSSEEDDDDELDDQIDEDEDRERERQREEDEEREREKEREAEEQRQQEEDERWRTREREYEEEKERRRQSGFDVDVAHFDEENFEDAEYLAAFENFDHDEDFWSVQRLWAIASKAGLRLTLTAKAKPEDMETPALESTTSTKKPI